MGFREKFSKILKKNKKYNIDSKYNGFKIDNISKSIVDNQLYLKSIFSKSSDIVYRDIFAGVESVHITLVYIDNMVDKTVLNENVLKPLLLEKGNTKDDLSITNIKNRILTVPEIRIVDTFDKLGIALLSGDSILLVDGFAKALVISTKGWKSRGIEEPTSEQTVGGSREGFIETLSSNITLIRRRIKDPNLGVEILQVGRRTKTNVAIIYLNGVTNEKLYKEIKKKIENIDTDEIIGSVEIAEMIEERKWSIFPQVITTERSDKASASILEGRVVVIVDGNPFVLIMPITFSMFLNSSDDYYERSVVTTLVRILRYSSFFVSSSLPALYLALTSHHPGMLPTSLVLSIISSRGGLPLPAFLEVLFMELTMQVLTEASIRLPKGIGQTISIVGGLVLGQAAVQAGMVSPIIVIVIALTAMTSFTIPVYSFTLPNRLIRIFLIIAASVSGLYGVVIGWLILIIHLASLESFNVRYLEDFSPYKFDKLKDTILKAHKSALRERQSILKPEDSDKQNS